MCAHTLVLLLEGKACGECIITIPAKSPSAAFFTKALLLLFVTAGASVAAAVAAPADLADAAAVAAVNAVAVAVAVAVAASVSDNIAAASFFLTV